MLLYVKRIFFQDTSIHYQFSLVCFSDYADSPNIAEVKSSICQNRRKSCSTAETISRSLELGKISTSTMDDLDAPQWADFLAPSPQVCLDDYFLRKHDDHEYREKLDSAESDSPNISIKNESIIHKTPVRILGPKGNKSSSSRKNKVKETTYENVLMEAMNNLQLSFKKPHGDKSLNKSCLVDSPAFKTPVKRVTRSMCAQVANSPQVNLDESHYATPSHEKTTAACDHEQPRKHEHQHEQPHGHDEHQHDLDESNKENIDIGEHGSPVNEQTSEINLEVTVISTEHDATLEKSEPEQEIEVEPEPDKGTQNDETHIPSKLPSKIVTSFATQNTGPDSGSKKKVATLTGNAWKRQMKRRMSITNQRRMSVHKPPPVTNKYVSMAEAVTKFHRTTPQRFHTTHVKTTRTEQLRRMSFKLTRATSPALLSKTRTRPVTAMSREEKERLELEKIRQNQIKANPVRKDILRKPAPLKRVQKKMVTNPEPFHLTEVKKGQLPKQNPEVKRLYRMKTKTVPAIVSTSDKQVIVQVRSRKFLLKRLRCAIFFRYYSFDKVVLVTTYQFPVINIFNPTITKTITIFNSHNLSKNNLLK